MIEITCICCPMGCPVSVRKCNSGYEYVEGACCGRGQKYAVSEASDPVRVVTAVINVEGCLEPLSVKTADAIPKGLVAEAVAEIKALSLRAPIKAGEVVLDNVCQTGVSVVATKTL